MSSGYGFACLAHHCPLKHDTVHGTIRHTINVLNEGMRHTVFFNLESAWSYCSPRPPVLQTTVSNLGSTIEEEGTYSSTLLSLDVKSTMIFDNVKNVFFFFFLRIWSRARDSFIFSVWWEPSLCLKEPPPFLEEMAQARAATKAPMPHKPWDTCSWARAIRNQGWGGKMDFINFRFSSVWTSTHKGKIIWFQKLIPLDFAVFEVKHASRSNL